MHMEPSLDFMQAVKAGTAKRRPQFPFLDLKAQFSSSGPEIIAAVMDVLDSQQFILGPEVDRLEEDLACLVGCSHAVGCASGSDALLPALMALDVRPGDEVITTPFTFVATAGSIARIGARPYLLILNLALTISTRRNRRRQLLPEREGSFRCIFSGCKQICGRFSISQTITSCS